MKDYNYFMVIIFDGRVFAESKKKLLRSKVDNLLKHGVTPALGSIYSDRDPGSVLYTRIKVKAAEEIGAKFFAVAVAEKEIAKIIKIVKSFNTDPKIYGLMVQHPSHKEDVISYNWVKIIGAINPKKDVDGLTEKSPYTSATVKAVLTILDYAEKVLKIDLKGKKFVVIGDRGMVGRPLITELVGMRYEVRGCNSETKNMGQVTQNADILISAAGKPGLIKKDMVKEDVVIIDVGSPRGDVDPEVARRVKFITPVPGGVGPVTVVCLLENLVEACYTTRDTHLSGSS